MPTKKKNNNLYDILPKPTKGAAIYPQIIRNNQQNVANALYRYQLTQAQNRQNNMNLKNKSIDDVIEDTLQGLRGFRVSSATAKHVKKKEHQVLKVDHHLCLINYY